MQYNLHIDINWGRRQTTHIMSPTNVCTNVNTSVHRTLKLKVLVSGVSRALKTFKGKVKLKTLMDWVTWGCWTARQRGLLN